MADPLNPPAQLATRLATAIGAPEIPAPEWALPHAHQLVAGLLFACLSTVALMYSIRVALQIRQPYPIYAMLAAGLKVFGEPFVDVLGHFKFPEIGVMPHLHAIGRSVPLYFAPAYLFYFGMFWLLTMRKIAAGVTTRSWWRWYGATVAFALAVEPPFIHLGWWVYYGSNQPLMFFGLPIWWGFANPAAALVSCAILQLVIRRRILTGATTLAIFPLLPAVFMGADTMMAWPLYVALNSSDSVLVTNLAQVATIGLALAAVWVCGRLLTDDPSESPMVESPMVELTPRVTHHAAAPNAPSNG